VVFRSCLKQTGDHGAFCLFKECNLLRLVSFCLKVFSERLYSQPSKYIAGLHSTITALL